MHPCMTYIYLVVSSQLLQNEIDAYFYSEYTTVSTITILALLHAKQLC